MLDCLTSRKAREFHNLTTRLILATLLVAISQMALAEGDISPGADWLKSRITNQSKAKILVEFDKAPQELRDSILDHLVYAIGPNPDWRESVHGNRSSAVHLAEAFGERMQPRNESLRSMLSQLNLSKSRPSLLEPDTGVARAETALKLLFKTKHPKATETAVGLLNQPFRNGIGFGSQIESIVYSAIALAANHGRPTPELSQGLRQIIRNNQKIMNQQVAHQAIVSLAKIEGEKARPLLESLFHEKNDPLSGNPYTLGDNQPTREAAAEGLSLVGGENAATQLMSCTANEKEPLSVRVACATNLGNIASTRVEQFLNILLNAKNTHRELRTAAAFGMIKQGTPTAIEHLEQFFFAGSHALRPDAWGYFLSEVPAENLLKYATSQRVPAHKKVVVLREIAETQPRKALALARINSAKLNKKGEAEQADKFATAYRQIFQMDPKLAQAAIEEFPSSDPTLNTVLAELIEDQFFTKKGMPEETIRRLLSSRQVPKRNPCDVVCDVAKRVAEWELSAKIKAVPFFGSNTGKKLALRSLAQTLLLQAAPLCPSGKEWVQSIQENWHAKLPSSADLKKRLSPQKSPQDRSENDEKYLHDLEGLMKANGESLNQIAEMRAFLDLTKNTPKNSDLVTPGDLYSKIFYLSFLYQLRETYPGRSTPKQLEESITIVKQAIAHDLGSHKDLTVVSQTTSGYQFHLLGASIISSPDNHDVSWTIRSQLEKLKNPMEVPYGLKHQPTSERASAGRVTLSYLSMLLRASKSRSDQLHFKNLIKNGIKNFLTYSSSLRAHVYRNDTHIGEDEMAPYYFYPNLPYVTAATQILLDSELLTEQERAEIEKYQTQLTEVTLSMLQENGLFTPLGPSSFRDSPSYANSFGALALLPLVRMCKDETGEYQLIKPSYGIVANRQARLGLRKPEVNDFWKRRQVKRTPPENH